ncbi:MAG TPA: HEAT repeat domain-containing protein [Acidimicrobiales bacterium]|nr:HEAT repeat domain-containing protein [Acidimicrobiales bacterium]
MDRETPEVAARRLAAVAAGHEGRPDEAAAALADASPAVRIAALGALRRLHALDARRLSVALADSEPGVRRRAAEEGGRVLARMVAGDAPSGTVDDVAALVVLVTGALEDADDGVVEASCWALGEAATWGTPAVPRLASLATGHGAPLVRESAVAALGAIGDLSALAAVLAALDDRPAVRRRAAVALAAFDDPRADAGLERCLADRDWQVRQFAEELLRD